MKALPVILCIALALSPLTAFVSCAGDETAGNCSYSLSVTTNADANVINVDETVTVVNTFKDGLTSLVFAFYPDAFTLKYPPPADGIMLDAAYPYGLNAGGYSFLEAGGDDVKSVSVCETPCKIVVGLSSPLALGEKTDVRFSFDLTLPYCNARYGYNAFSVNLTFFFPVLCRYDNAADDFVFYDYIATGDPFCFDVADYSLSLDCPDDWAVACSAPAARSRNGKRYFSARSLRDLSLILAPEAEVSSATADGYTAYVIHDGSYDYAARYAADALAVFSDAFCDLPTKEYYLVFTPFMTAGAEFCNLALFSSSLSFAETEKVVAHEVAHQWWYNLVGSDQVSAPWQDEALAQWSTLYYFVQKGMVSYADALKESWASSYSSYTDSQRALGEAALCDVFRATTEYRDCTDYFVTVYCKAALATDMCAQSVTRDTFAQALSDYAKNNSLGFASQDALFDSLDAYGAGKFFRSALSASLY